MEKQLQQCWCIIFLNQQVTALVSVGISERVFARQLASSDYEYYVLELSSFQLDDLKDFRADISVLLNITPDHLDRYENDMNLYVNSKMKIINNQTEKRLVYL